jgi:hypothetical protein
MNAERNTAVLITMDKNKRLEVKVEKAYLPDAIQLCLAAIEALCKQTLSRADDPDLVKSLEEDMYEMINIGASSLLDKMFPHIEMRPDVTVDALLKVEDELISEKGAEYAEAYGESAQAQKDIYEHNLAKANIKAKEMNREQRRKAGIKNK